jgi:hypothetical protein
MDTHRRLRGASRLAAVALLALPLGCGEGGLGPFELQSRRATWDAREPTGYEFDVTWSCFCLPAVTQGVTVVVMDGVVTRRFYAATGTDLDDDVAATFTDIDGLFDLLEEVARDDPHALDIEYDADFGYPRRIVTDMDERMADDEFEIEVTSFRPALTAQAKR